MSHEVIIETRNLTKVYRDFWGRPKVQALKALDLQVHRGEIFGLLGPNGSGKTTTIKLLLGLLFATEGEALIFNEPTTNVAKNERIGYLPEESYLYKFLNAEETLHFYGRLFKISAAERNKRVGRLIDMVGLTGAKHRQLREYSKGMQRRIGLAQALINNPELILLDEPTSGLDPIGTSEIKHLIRELREQGKTIVLSGHLLADMQDICDRIAILHRGELKEIGRVSDLLTVQDVTQIKARNLSPAAIEEIRDVIHRHGGEDVTVDHPTTTLEELFLRIVQESELHPGAARWRTTWRRQNAAVGRRAGRHTVENLIRHRARSDPTLTRPDRSIHARPDHSLTRALNAAPRSIGVRLPTIARPGARVNPHHAGHLAS